MKVLTNTKARPVAGMSFDDSGIMLIAGGSEGFDVWDLLQSTHRFIRSHAVKYLYGCMLDPMHLRFYVSDYARGFRIVSFSDRKAPPVPGSVHQRHVTTFDLTADGRMLLMGRGGAGSNRVECWNVSESFTPMWSLLDGKPIDPDEPYLLNQADWFTNGVAISRDGKRIATAESRGGGGMSGVKPLIALRQGKNGKIIAELGKSATSFDTRLAIAKDGRAVFAWDNNVLERWDVKAARRSKKVASPGRGYFRGLAVDPSGKWVITASGDGQLRCWDADDLSLIDGKKCGIGPLHSVAASPSGISAAGGDKGKVVVWQVGSDGKIDLE